MKRVVKISIYIIVWSVIVAFVLYLASVARHHRAFSHIVRVEISILSEQGEEGLVTREMVEQMLSEAEVVMLGETLRTTPLRRIEQVIAENGFVEQVSAYVDYTGVLYIDVLPRNPLARIMLNGGYDSYITREGFVFVAPASTTLYKPIITGDYRPLFDPKYTGMIERCAEGLCEELELQIERVEREKYPIYLRNEENAEQRREVRRRYINKTMLESKEEFAQRVLDLRRENHKRREMIAYKQRMIDADMMALVQQQDDYRAEQKKVRERCDDIYNLAIFVEIVESDPFWQSEVLQIELSQVEEQLCVTLVVRSGRFFISLGSISAERGSRESIERRLAKVRRLYSEVLPQVGWDRYREISVEFDGQVVCSK